MKLYFALVMLFAPALYAMEQSAVETYDISHLSQAAQQAMLEAHYPQTIHRYHFKHSVKDFPGGEYLGQDKKASSLPQRTVGRSCKNSPTITITPAPGDVKPGIKKRRAQRTAERNAPNAYARAPYTTSRQPLRRETAAQQRTREDNALKAALKANPRAIN